MLVALGAELAATVLLRTVPVTTPEITGPEAALLQAQGAAARGPFVALLGDSVMGAGALARAQGGSAADYALGALVRRRILRASESAGVADLSMEGALANDYAGLIELLLQHGRRPAAVMMQLDYRVLSPVHDTEQNLSRTWLQPYVPTVKPAVAKEYGSPEFLRRPIDEWTQRTLLRSSAYVLLRGGRPLVAEWAHAAAGSGRAAPQPADPAMLKLLVERFYGTDRSVAQSRVLTDLLNALDLLARNGIPVLVGFTPTNFSFLGASANVAAYQANVAALGAAVRARAHGGAAIRWVNFEGYVPPAWFLDHCHLTPTGNVQISERMFEELALLLDDARRRR